MNRYSFTLMQELVRYPHDDFQFTIDSTINDLLQQDFDDFDWVLCVVNLELIYSISIPDELADRHHLTLHEFGLELEKLPEIPAELYSEYADLKMVMMEDNLRLADIQIASDGGREEEIRELEERLDYIDVRLSQLLNEAELMRNGGGQTTNNSMN
jgi:hypothetical protein